MRLHHDFIWSTLVHFSTNLWYDIGNTRCDSSKVWKSPASPTLRFDRSFWREYCDKLVSAGNNAVVIDLGDAMVYDSHPELAVEGAFTKEEMRRELDRLNSLGLEVIPKLNFSATHDVWLGEYSRMLSTAKYYEVCKDIIDEVCELFEPRYFHIGFDEETYEHQKDYDYITVRNSNVWWHDLKYIAECVERNSARALVWSDYARSKPDEFVTKLPKSVIAVNWYYFNEFYGDVSEVARVRIDPFRILDEHGFDQIPGGSVEYFKDNLKQLSAYCEKVISPERLFGFIETTWAPVLPEYRELLFDGADAVADAISTFNINRKGE